jgi:hypothetical protein
MGGGRWAMGNGGGRGAQRPDLRINKSKKAGAHKRAARPKPTSLK